jgi:hypothetical protein
MAKAQWASTMVQLYQRLAFAEKSEFPALCISKW